MSCDTLVIRSVFIRSFLTFWSTALSIPIPILFTLCAILRLIPKKSFSFIVLFVSPLAVLSVSSFINSYSTKNFHNTTAKATVSISNAITNKPKE